MSIAIYKARRVRTNSRGRRPSKSRDDALQTHMENAFQASYAQGIRRLKANVSTQKMADAYYSKNYAQVMIDVPFEDFNKYLAEAIGEIHAATSLGGQRAARIVPNLDSLRYDLNNSRIRDYLEQRTGALISGVTDDFQASVQDMIATRFAQGATTKDLTVQIGEQLRATIGLDRVSAGALKNANASGKYDEAGLRDYEDRLFDGRAERIARTEIAFANNEGQMAVWDAAQDQGLIPENAEKVWVCDANPCEDCAPMDGISVPLGEEFLAPSGITTPSPPLHPHCYCIMAISQDGGQIDAPEDFDRD